VFEFVKFRIGNLVTFAKLFAGHRLELLAGQTLPELREPQFHRLAHYVRL
jgi:hypothetical protein